MSKVFPQPTEPAADRYLTIEAVASRWRVSTASVRTWITRGRLRAVLVRDRLCVPVDEIRRVSAGVADGFLDL